MPFRQSLENWIQDALHDPDKEGPCEAIGLFHIKSSSGGIGREEVHTTKITGQATAAQIANLLRDKADTFAQGFTGSQAFRVVAFYKGDTPDAWRASYPLQINGILDHDGGATESPNKDGLVAQIMRHNEAVMQQTFLQQNRIAERYDRMVGSLSTHFEALARSNSELRQESMEAWEFVKKLVLMKETDAHELRMKEAEYERSTSERQQLMKILPALANTAFGKEVIPQSHADSAILEAILERVTPDQLTFVVQALGLPNEVVAPLIARAADMAKKKEKEAKELAEGKLIAMGAGDE